MCELCNLEKKTKWYYEDRYFIICDCLTCEIPMIVIKSHQSETPLSIKAWYVNIIKTVFKKNFHFRKEMRKIKDHWHWHIILEEGS